MTATRTLQRPHFSQRLLLPPDRMSITAFDIEHDWSLGKKNGRFPCPTEVSFRGFAGASFVLPETPPPPKISQRSQRFTILKVQGRSLIYALLISKFVRQLVMTINQSPMAEMIPDT